MAIRLRHAPSKPKETEVFNAYVIICNAHDACKSFLNIFESSRRLRNARGAPTDEDQDLLRAMLIFATSGLDSMAKQLVRDALPAVVERHEGARKVVTTHVERTIRKSDQTDAKILATVLMAKQPRKAFIDYVINDLTSSSLQSTEELLKIAAYFDIPSNKLIITQEPLTEIFRARNQIIHEMDIDFAQPRRNRRPRRKETMVKYTNEILKISSAFLKEVIERI